MDVFQVAMILVFIDLFSHVLVLKFPRFKLNNMVETEFISCYITKGSEAFLFKC